MISEDIVNRICIERGLKKMGISSVPTWIDQNKQEGIELRITGVNSFWAKDGSRNYVEPASTHIAETLKLINELANGKIEVFGLSELINEYDNGKVEEPKRSEGALHEEVPHNNVALLPDFLTPTLMSKWAKMNTVDRMLLFQRTPPDQIFLKPVSKTESVSYVKGNYMIKEANAAFLFDWKFVHQGLSIGEKGVCVYGVIEANVDGKVYSRPAVGYEEINQKMTAQLAIKSATTDAIKKGLSLFGFNSDVYSGEI